MTKLERMLGKQGLFIGAHRGFSTRYPENTLLAVKEAVDLGVDMVEIDVYTSRDGVPVIAHDCRLERCSTGTGNIHQYTLKELKEFDFGVHRGSHFEGLRLPTLEQFLDYMKDYPEVLLDIDFKVYDYTMETAKTALPIIESSGLLNRCVFNCIDFNVLDYLYEQYGRRTIGAPHDFHATVNYRHGRGGSLDHMWGICMPFNMLTEERVKVYRDAGLAISCTPADTHEQVAYAIQHSLTMPLCNDPREYMRIAKEKGIWSSWNE